MANIEGRVGAALTGALTAGLASWSRYDDDQNRRVRNLKVDLIDVRDALAELLSRGEVIRSRMPVVEDAQVGLALATKYSPSPQAIPSVQSQMRPAITSDAVVTMSWPPSTGTYDSKGNVSDVGEVAASFLAMTYEEFRSVVLALAQETKPTLDQRTQIYYAFNQLVAELYGRNLNAAQFREVWRRLFDGAPVSSSVAVGDAAHRDPMKPPVVVGALGANVSSVLSLTSSGGVPAHPFANPHTDAGSRWRITSSGAVSAGIDLCQIRFGTDYRYRANNGVVYAFQPIVMTSFGASMIYADKITPAGFSLVAFQGLQANSTVDVFVSVSPGIQTEG